MAKNENPIPWSKDVPKVEETLFSFSKPIKTPSLCLKKSKGADMHQLREFKTGRLIEINSDKKEFSFVGHKIAPKNGRNNEKRYIFTVSFHEMEQLVS